MHSAFIRPWHSVRHNRRTSVPRSVVYLGASATVTRNGRAAPSVSRLGEWSATHYVRRRMVWEGHATGRGASPAAWWHWLDGATTGRPVTWIVCLDAASVSTWLSLWTQIECEGWTVETAIIDALPWIVQVYTGDRRYLWCDAGNWCPTWGDSAATLTAAEQESRIASLGLALMMRWRAEDLGTWRPTAAGCAWSLYRHRHMSERIEIHGVRKVLEMERAAYRGGRCECLYQGEVIDPDQSLPVDGYIGERDFGVPPRGPIHVYDIRSAYPAAMRGRYYPCELLGTESACEVRQLKALLRRYAVVAHVELQATHDYPQKGDDGRVHYARGYLVATLAGPELARALEADEVRSVGRVAWYRRARLFDSWVDWIERELRAGDDCCEHWADWVKQAGRCLYGRFGYHGRDWIDAGASPPDHPWGPAWEVDRESATYRAVRDLAGHRQRQGDEHEGPDSFPAISAHVTSYLRVHMDALLAIVGHRHCYYYDTDELHVDSEGQHRLEMCDCVGSALGQLKLKASAQSAEYWGPRHYRLGDTHVWAGVSGSRCTPTETGILQVAVRERTRSVLARQLDGTVREVWRPIHPVAWVPPAGVDADGWVRPLVMGGGTIDG